MWSDIKALVPQKEAKLSLGQPTVLPHNRLSGN